MEPVSGGAQRLSEGDKPTFVVALGASAGGLEALEQFFKGMPKDGGISYVVVQHLSPDHKSHMVELLTRHTPLRVVAAEDGMPLTPDTIFLIPPKKTLEIRRGLLWVADRGRGLTLPVDILFRSLAEDLGDRGIAVILSGTGSDGTRGVRAVKEAGGLVLVQSPETAKFDGMPRAAISSGAADFVIPIQEMPETLLTYTRRFDELRQSELPHEELERGSPLAELFNLLLKQTGVDFSSYKVNTVTRRVQRRMAMGHHRDLASYVATAESSPAEVGALFRELLINVTAFFRDPDGFDALRTEVIPHILDGLGPRESIRVWCPGCASGEEAYSLAMLFEEAFELSGRTRDLKIFATDIDREALEIGGAGLYSAGIEADISPERLERFFSRQGDRYQIARFLRQRVVFAYHDVARDPPFGRVSLLSCRNLLIYFTPPLQSRVLGAFRFALRPGGFLFLGGSETPGEIGDDFRVINAPAKIFRRTSSPSSMPVPLRASRGSGVFSERDSTGGLTGATQPLRAATELLLREHVPPSFLLDETHEILHVFGEPSSFVRFNPGEATLNLLTMLPSSVSSVVSLATHRAFRDDTESRYENINSPLGPVNVVVRPISARGGARYSLVSVFPATPRTPATGDANAIAEDVQNQIADLQQELQFSRENLQATIEELETSNEELQATNEELMASNEELQSTNEELQSVNEELHTLNAEYQRKISELISLNEDVDNLLRSTRLGLIFLDRDLRIMRFTPVVTQVMNLLDRDVGRPISDIVSRIPGDWLVDSLHAVQKTGAVIEREFGLLDEREFRIRIEPYVSSGISENQLVISILDVTQLKSLERRMGRVLDALPQEVAVLDRRGVIVLVNQAWLNFGAANGGEDGGKTGIGANYLEVCRAPLDTEDGATAAEVAEGILALLDGRRRRFECEYPCHGADGQQRWFLLQATAMEGDDGGCVVSHVNVTARKLLELRLGKVSAQATIS